MRDLRKCGGVTTYELATANSALTGAFRGLYGEKPRATLPWRNDTNYSLLPSCCPEAQCSDRRYGMKTYYETLEITREASAAQIRRAYRSLVKQCHPDLFPSGSA